MTGGGNAEQRVATAVEGKSCRRLDLIKDETLFEDGKAIISARLESDRDEPQRIWFELPERFFYMTTASMDPFVIAVIFQAMKEPTELHVRGQVSSTLLRNLAEFQAVWQCWFPTKYFPVAIAASRETADTAERESRAIAAFSGGVDSTYTIWCHTMGGAGRLTRKVEAGLLVHGFDIPLEQVQQFERASNVARETLSNAGIDLITMKTNLYDPDWEMTHGAAIAACMSLLKSHFSEGLIASTYSYHSLNLPWGSNPITDPLLSCGAFAIVHDGAGVRRNEKQTQISKWKAGFDNLRVCYESEDRDKNCCRCAKCLMLFVSLKAQGLPLPASFDIEITPAELLKCTRLNPAFLSVFEIMLERYETSGFENQDWFRAFKRCVKFNSRRNMLEKPLSNPLRDWLRQRQLEWVVRSGP
ncbi:MAG: hypothetical protein C0469_15735 [Cyanobacteria bacterium DS2.3.42]|nr:hypothetical protein [Cyanobacteria bacterium DS2.3.42]